MLIYYNFVRIATSNDPWGPTGTEMGEIAAMTFHRLAITPLYKDPLQSYSPLLVYNFSYFLLTGYIKYSPSDFYEIMDMLDKRLNDKGKNWRHVLKSLKVLDYCLHEGSEMVVTWARKNIYIIKTLREFQYIDEDGRDVGQNG